MDTERFLHTYLRDFLRAPDTEDIECGVRFLELCLHGSQYRDFLIAWLSAAGRESFQPAAATVLLRMLLQAQQPVPLVNDLPTVNIVGTGGGIGTFNISTAAAFVVAACGVAVMKTGSQAYSSQCGALDVQNQLGVLWNGSQEQLAEHLQEYRLLFVPNAHYSPHVRKLVLSVAPLPIKAVGRLLNLIGPLLCPYLPSVQITGVAQAALLHRYAEFVRQNSKIPMWLVHGAAGMDELCSVTDNQVSDVHQRIDLFNIHPESFGCQSSAHANEDLALLAGASNASEAALIIERVLAGQAHPVQYETVALNAAAAIYLSGSTDQFSAAYQLALAAIKDGAPARLLARVRQAITQRKALRINIPGRVEAEAAVQIPQQSLFVKQSVNSVEVLS